MKALASLWSGWVRIWNLREPPIIQAMLRIGLGLVILADLLTILRLELVLPLFAPPSAGGFSASLTDEGGPLLYAWIRPSATTAWLHFMGLLLTATTFTLGLATRASALFFVLLSAQHAPILPLSDRAVDLLIRNILLILALSSAHRTASIDAWRRTGRFFDPRPVPAWPRHLVILQLVLMYFSAGVQKVGLLWTPFGRFDALYMILQDVAMARFDGAWLIEQPWLTLTRIGTAGTWLWEWSAPLVLLIYLAKSRPSEARSRWGAWAVRYRLHLIWASVGIFFHLMLALTLELGIFPWAMLALYPAFLHPDELRHALHRLGLRGRR